MLAFESTSLGAIYDELNVAGCKCGSRDQEYKLQAFSPSRCCHFEQWRCHPTLMGIEVNGVVVIDISKKASAHITYLSGLIMTTLSTPVAAKM